MAKRVDDKTKESVEIKDVTLKELSRFFNGPIRIRTSRFGRLRFQMITMGDIDFFQELIKHNPPAREFVIQIIHHQLFSPKLSVDTIRNWKEKLIIRVASIWVKNNPELAEYLTENELSIELIKKIIINYMKKQLQYFSRQNEALVRMMNLSHSFVGCQAFESAQKLSEMTKLASGFENDQRMSDMVWQNPAFENVQRMSDMVWQNPALESAQRISDMIGHNPTLENAQRMSDMVWQNPALESAQRISDMIGNYPTLENAQRMSDMVWQNPALESAQRISNMIGHNPTLENAQRMSDMVWQNPALESAQRISDMVWQNSALESAQRISDMIGYNPTLESAQRLGDVWTNQINASDLQLATISQYPLKEIALSQISNSDAANLSKSFMDLFSDFQENINQTNIKFPTITSELEARELFTTTNLVKSILAKEPSNEYDENEIIEYEISIETDDRLQMLLLELDPQLISMWLGAKEAINSNNPDYARHFSVSLSELFANVLQRLAPDNEIRSWSDSREDFREGKPTNEARLQYIYREANDHSFGLTKKFISFALELMDFLNSGTHKSITHKVNKQFRMILMQFELVISQLIETSQLINSLQLNSLSLNNSSVSVNSIASTSGLR